MCFVQENYQLRKCHLVKPNLSAFMAFKSPQQPSTAGSTQDMESDQDPTGIS
ncbi:hypothetical protein DPMN_008508 [Dreissena polymorpha]|uniref:Uncharacterized protein n=1 Tax=Dreissena polymorpha TaxID=45954 RepID=A0A9D4MXX0_DREPO|nr:hypothetical protein DPMN_008508 [Dreissena polymorpha]